MKIRKFSMKHYEEAMKIWKKTGLTITPSDDKKGIKIMIKRNPKLCLVGIMDKKVVATVMGGFDGRRGYVHHLAVDPALQKKGFGKTMLSELIKRFKRMNVYKIHLFVEKESSHVLDFYLKLGWEMRNDLIMMSFVP